MRLKITTFAPDSLPSSDPPAETGPADTKAVLVFREPNPRKLSIERSEAKRRIDQVLKEATLLWWGRSAAPMALSGTMRTMSALGRAATVAALA